MLGVVVFTPIPRIGVSVGKWQLTIQGGIAFIAANKDDTGSVRTVDALEQCIKRIPERIVQENRRSTLTYGNRLLPALLAIARQP